MIWTTILTTSKETLSPEQLLYDVIGPLKRWLYNKGIIAGIWLVDASGAEYQVGIWYVSDDNYGQLITDRFEKEIEYITLKG